MAPGQRYGFRADGPWDPQRGRVFNPAKLLLDPYARAVSGRWSPTARSTATAARRRRDLDDVRAAHAGPAATSTPRRTSPQLGRGARRLRLGRRRRSPAAAPVDRHDRLRAARQGLHAAARRGARGAPRHLRRADHQRRGALPQGPRRHHRRAAAGAPVRLRAATSPSGADQLLGLQLARLLRAARRLQLDRRPGPAGQRVQGDGQGAARGRPRGDPRRRLQPHRRGQPARADAVVPRPRRRRLLQARRLGERRRRRTSTSPAAATPSTRPTRRRCG